MTKHKQFLDKLQKSMRNDYIAVKWRKNPVAQHAQDATAQQLLHVIGQYAIFPKNIVGFLGNIRDTTKRDGWEKVSSELERNIGEELGHGNDGVVHYDMLVKGVSEGLAQNVGKNPATMEAYLRELKPAKAMEGFVNTMYAITAQQDPAYVTGVAYGLEASAVPELVIVRKLVDMAFEKITAQKMHPSSDLRKFFDLHLNVWEIGHEDELRKASEPYITTPKQRASFEAGFRDTMQAEDKLWNGLYAEIQAIE